MFDIQGARFEGYSDEEIAKYLAPKINFNIDAALREGYSHSEIVDYLGQRQEKISGENVGEIKVLSQKEKPGELSAEKKKQIDIWKDAIGQTLKKYGKPGQFTITSEGISFGEGQVSYDTLVEKAKTDPIAKRDLARINHWIEQISKEAGLPKKPVNDPLGIRRK